MSKRQDKPPGYIRYHNQIDNSVQSLDREVLEFDCSEWDYHLTKRMETWRPADLRQAYPELVFKEQLNKPKKGDCDYWAKTKKHYLVARWRTIKDA